MILHIEERDRVRYADELNQYFRLRKRVFHDKLNWEVTPEGGMERDPLDDAPCTYTLYINDDGKVAAGARLIPTTQTTLLDMAFDGLVPEEIAFRSPTIWESSRFCIDHDLANERLSSGAKKANIALVIGNFDYAIDVGISHYIAVVESRLFKHSQNYIPDVEILGEKQMSDCDVICALYSISEAAQKKAKLMRALVS